MSWSNARSICKDHNLLILSDKTLQNKIKDRFNRDWFGSMCKEEPVELKIISKVCHWNFEVTWMVFCQEIDQVWVIVAQMLLVLWAPNNVEPIT